MAELTASHLPAAAHDDHGHMSEEEHNNNMKLGVWLYLASEIVIFSIMIVGYIIFRINEKDIVAQAHEELGVALVTANTFVLLASSFFMVMGLRAMQGGNRAGMAALDRLDRAGRHRLFGRAIHRIQRAGASGYRARLRHRFRMEHLRHALLRAHLLPWRPCFRRRALGAGSDAARRKGPLRQQPPSASRCSALYWHFVDVVWIMLFTLIYLVLGARPMAEAMHHEGEHHSNTVRLLGREITVEGGVYTVVFGALAVLTVIEVVSAEFLNGAIHDAPDAAAALQAIKAILLLGIAIIKSSLVIWFYMHLKTESRLIAIVILLPLLIAGTVHHVPAGDSTGRLRHLSLLIGTPAHKLIYAQVCYTGARIRVGG